MNHRGAKAASESNRITTKPKPLVLRTFILIFSGAAHSLSDSSISAYRTRLFAWPTRLDAPDHNGSSSEFFGFRLLMQQRAIRFDKPQQLSRHAILSLIMFFFLRQTDKAKFLNIQITPANRWQYGLAIRLLTIRINIYIVLVNEIDRIT